MRLTRKQKQINNHFLDKKPQFFLFPKTTYMREVFNGGATHPPYILAYLFLSFIPAMFGAIFFGVGLVGTIMSLGFFGIASYIVLHFMATAFFHAHYCYTQHKAHFLKKLDQHYRLTERSSQTAYAIIQDILQYDLDKETRMNVIQSVQELLGLSEDLENAQGIQNQYKELICLQNKQEDVEGEKRITQTIESIQAEIQKSMQTLSDVGKYHTEIHQRKEIEKRIEKLRTNISPNSPTTRTSLPATENLEAVVQAARQLDTQLQEQIQV